MKKVLLFFALSLCCTLPGALAQSLQANAGRDTAFCFPPAPGWTGYVIGGNPSASGGTAPYTYQWRVLSGTIGLGYLNSATVANPLLNGQVQSNVPLVDYELQVTDANNNTSRDTVRIAISYFSCITGSCEKGKKVQDTVQLNPTCMSNSLPITYRWSPGNTLIDSTVMNPLSFTPVNQSYICLMTDAYGCKKTTNCWVEITNVGVNKVPVNTQKIMIAPNPLTHESNVIISREYLDSKLVLFSVDGKLVAETTLSALNTPVKQVLPVAGSGIYFYKVLKAGAQITAGKLVFQ